MSTVIEEQLAAAERIESRSYAASCTMMASGSANLGKDAGGLSASTIGRLKEAWSDELVARTGVGWTEKPWVPPIQVAGLRQKKV
jgi:hypothetical protein